MKASLWREGRGRLEVCWGVGLLVSQWAGEKTVEGEKWPEVRDSEGQRAGLDDRLGMEVRVQEGDQDLKLSFLAHVAGLVMGPTHTGNGPDLGMLRSW